MSKQEQEWQEIKDRIAKEKYASGWKKKVLVGTSAVVILGVVIRYLKNKKGRK